MKLNIANPTPGRQKKLEIDDDQKLRTFLDKGSHKRLVEMLWERGFVFKIMGGCDKQGFPMKQGVLTSGYVRLLLNRVSKSSRTGYSINFAKETCQDC